MWVTWWIRSILIYFLISVYITVITRIVFPADTSKNPFVTQKSVFVNTDWFIFFIFLLTYSIQVATFTILIAQFFSKSKCFTTRKSLLKKINKHSNHFKNIQLLAQGSLWSSFGSFRPLTFTTSCLPPFISTFFAFFPTWASALDSK